MPSVKKGLVKPPANTGYVRRTVVKVLSDTNAANLSADDQRVDGSIIGRVKLLMIFGFVLMHIFKVFSSIRSTGPQVDITEPTIAKVLEKLLKQHKASVHGSLPLIVEVFPPLRFHVASSKQNFILSAISQPLEALFNACAVYIQHPIISKWLTLALCVSLFLNTYLFKVVRQPKQADDRGKQPDSPAVETPRPAPVRLAPAPTARSAASNDTVRPVEECLALIKSPETLNDEEIISLVQSGKMASYALEKVLGDFTRAVRIRRAIISRASITKTLETSALPLENYYYENVLGACCENVIGYMPLPVGVAGKIPFLFLSSITTTFTNIVIIGTRSTEY